MSNGVSDHICNVYCRDGEHCELIYAETDDQTTIAHNYAYYLGVRVTRVEPAREAMPLADLPQGQEVGAVPLTLKARMQPSDKHRLLVYYREEQQP
jgi:hypothetical protein